MTEALSSRQTAHPKGRLRSTKQPPADTVAMGPDLLAAFAGNDASGIAAFASAGATSTATRSWTVPLILLLNADYYFRNCISSDGLCYR